MRDLTPELLALLKSKLQAGSNGFRGKIEVDHRNLTTGVMETIEYRCSTIDLDKSLRLIADQAKVTFPWRDGYGWGDDSIFRTNTRCRIFQWYGSDANRVRTFTGILDRPRFSRDPAMVELVLRDMMALLIDQHVVIAYPQKAGETGAVRNETNGVYLDWEVADIVSDILDRVGWPAADRAITPTSYVVEEYALADGWSYAEAIVGDDRLSGLVGYEAFADEDGVFVFRPSVETAAITELPTADYTFRTGQDITALEEEVDQADLRTRVRVRGPLTSQVPQFKEVWRTTKFPTPIGLWHDADEATMLRILDRNAKRIYKIRRSDRKTIASFSVATILPYPGGLSGDPPGDDYFWVLNAPWRAGVAGGNRVKKVRQSDKHVVGNWSISSDRWAFVAASANFVWMGNLDDDRIYKRDRSTLAVIASYRHRFEPGGGFPQTNQGTLQTNPNGMLIDGTTCYVQWGNGNHTPRFLVFDESAPTTIIRQLKTTGTYLRGGDIEPGGGIMWGFYEGAHVVAEYDLLTPVTNQVFAEVVDSDLEDELGLLAQVEPRIHDTHSTDAEHPFEVRRDTVSIPVVISIAQAQETAARRLDLLASRRDVVDAGVIGNPGIQKTDIIGVVDPVTSTNRLFTLDTYRVSMAADGTYLGVVALLPIPGLTELEAEAGEIDEEGEAEEDPIPSVVQWDAAAGDVGLGHAPISLPAPAGTGDLLVLVAAVRGSSGINTPSGFSEIAGSPVGSGLIGSSTPNAGLLHVFTKVAVGGEQNLNVTEGGGTANIGAVLFELAGVSSTPNDIETVDNVAANTHPTIPGLTAPSGGKVVLAGLIPCGPQGATQSTYSPDSGYTEHYDDIANSGGTNGPNIVVLSLTAEDATTSYTPGATSDTPITVKHAGIAVTFAP